MYRIYLHTYIHTCMHACMHACTCISTYIYAGGIYTYTHTHVCMYACMYTYISTCMQIHIDLHTCLHVHTLPAHLLQHALAAIAMETPLIKPNYWPYHRNQRQALHSPLQTSSTHPSGPIRSLDLQHDGLHAELVCDEERRLRALWRFLMSLHGLVGS